MTRRTNAAWKKMLAELDPIADQLAAWITRAWGERCALDGRCVEYEPGCHTCEAWKAYDEFMGTIGDVL